MSGDDNFISRWSKRKIAVREGRPIEKAPPAPPAAVPAQQPTPAAGRAPTAGVVPESSGTPPLPPVESLTPESDFTPFMKPGVDPGLKREALKALFRDPRFNVMDGLDVYIDDYSIPDPLPPEWLAQMNQMKHLGAYVEPTEEEAKEKAAEKAPEAAPEEAAELPKAMQDQPVALAENEAPVDTPVAQSPEPDDGDTAPKRE